MSSPTVQELLLLTGKAALITGGARNLGYDMALALAEAQRTEHLRTALLNRDVIGQAKGIIMARYNIDADAAFATLKRISQDQNKKLHEIARQVTENRELPGTTEQ